MVSALAAFAVLVKNAPSKERTPAWAKRGTESNAKEANPVKSLKNKSFLAFFDKRGLPAEEGSDLRDFISLF
jgi:hypothetical protein